MAEAARQVMANHLAQVTVILDGEDLFRLTRRERDFLTQERRRTEECLRDIADWLG